MLKTMSTPIMQSWNLFGSRETVFSSIFLVSWNSMYKNRHESVNLNGGYDLKQKKAQNARATSTHKGDN